jgi:phenylalanyl-tRNA synthetase beta chain
MIAVARVHELLAMHDDIHVHEPAHKGNLSQQATTIDIHMDTINQFLGTSYSIDDLEQQLMPLGFGVDGTQVRVPSFRAHDCQEWPDIAEEMCRFSGIEDIKDAPMAHILGVEHDPMWMKRRDFQQRALHLGLTEVVPFPLLENDVDGQPVILNPITPELTNLRSNAMQSLIDIAAFNATRHPWPCRIFSMGPVWSSGGEEAWHFSAFIAGDRHHEPHARAHQTGIDFYYMKGVVEQLLGHEFDVQRSNHSRLHPGQSADILVDAHRIGCFGMVHPSIQSKRKLGVCGLIEFNLEAPVQNSTHQYHLISKYPSTTRDVTYIMDQGVSVGDALAILRANKPTACESIILCGVYQKPGRDEVNVSFRMIYQDNDGSLEMAEVNAIHKTFAEEVVQKLPCRFP